MKLDLQGSGVLGHDVRLSADPAKCVPNEILVALISSGRQFRQSLNLGRKKVTRLRHTLPQDNSPDQTDRRSSK